MRRTLATVIAISTVLCVGEPEFALADSVSPIEEIVVTARRKEESLSKVPVSVIGISSSELGAQSIFTQFDVQTAAPGLIVRTTQGSSNFNYAIRGQSIDAFSNSQPAVLSYINEFQMTAFSAGSLYDLSSVQVLKGPQGTLFGRNTTGGAVLYTTEQPQYGETTGFVGVTLGERNLQRYEAKLNFSQSDNFAVRIAGISERQDGFVKNLVNGDELNDVDRDSVRLSLAWQGERFENVLVGEVGRADGNGDPMLLYSANAPGAIGPDGMPLVSTIATFYSPILDSITGPGSYDALTNAFPYTPADGYLGFVDAQRRLGFEKTALDGKTSLDAENWYVINTTTVSLSDDSQFKAIVGYSENENFSEFDQDASPFPFYAYVSTLNDSENWSAELQLSGSALDQRIDYIVGAYYSSEDRTNGQNFTYFDLGPVANPILGPAFGAPTLPLSNALFGNFDTTTYGAFAQATYHFEGIDGLSATAGYRETKESLDYTYLSGFAPVFASGVKESLDDSEPSWTLGLDYAPDDEWFMYATMRGSWRGGGFNHNAPPVNAPASGGGNRFEAEQIEDVEIGVKFQGLIGSIPARVNLAAYWQEVDDVQRIAYVTIPGSGPAAVTVNANGAEYDGIELDWDLALLDWLRLGGSYNTVDAEYTGNTADNLFGTFFNFSTFADLPERTAKLFLEASFSLPEQLGFMSLRVDGYQQSSMYISNYGKSSAPGTKIDGYELINFQAAIEEIAGSNFSVRVFVKNVTDEEYFSGGIGLGTSPGYNSVVLGTPRYWGVTLEYER